MFDVPVWGYYHNDYAGDSYIHIDYSVDTKALFINTLAHEMVHQLQHERGLGINHGRFFKQQIKRLRKHGLEI